MIKQGLSNFFKNLQYFFTPLGTLFLGILFGVCFLFTGFKVQINTAVSDIQSITEQANIDFDQMENCVVESFTSLPWDKPIEAVKTLTSKDWLNNTLKANLEKTIENYKLYAQEIEKSVSAAISGLKKYIVAFAMCAILGLLGGIVLTEFLIRRKIDKRNTFKLIIASIIDSIFTIGITALTLWLATLWTPNLIIVNVLGIVVYGFITLFEAFLLYARKKISIKQILDFKHIVKLSVSNLLIYIISFAISALIIAIANAFVGIFIALPLLIIAIIVISLNAETYVKAEVEKSNNKPQKN